MHLISNHSKFQQYSDFYVLSLENSWKVTVVKSKFPPKMGTAVQVVENSGKKTKTKLHFKNSDELRWIRVDFDEFAFSRFIFDIYVSTTVNESDINLKVFIYNRDSQIVIVIIF